MEGNGDRIKVHERLATLEIQVGIILKNHLPHIQTTIDKLTSKFWAIILLLVANLVGMVVALVTLLMKFK